MRINKGDKVIILSGKDKGKTGPVLSTMPKVNRLVVEGVNIQKRHKKATNNKDKSGVIEDAHPIHVSKVAIVRPGKKPMGSRIGYKLKEDGKKVRVYRQAGNKEIK